MESTKFDIFNVYESGNKNFVFVPECLTTNPPDFNCFLDYFFGENACWNHFICQYRRITFLENDIVKIKSRLYTCLNSFLTNSKIYKQTDDKVGMFGDHCLSILLEQYFEADCLINKCVDMKSSPKMPVFGCDVIYYSKGKNSFLFGEAKFTDKVESGIQLIKDDLKEYEERIENEYTCVITKCVDDSTQELLGPKLNNVIETTLSLKEAAKRANMKYIYVPLFIMHGGDLDPETILKKIDVLGGVKFLDLETRYYVISLPVGNKECTYNMFEAYINQKVEQLKKEVEDEYE